MPRPRCNSCYYLGQQTVHDDPTVNVCRRQSPIPVADDDGRVSERAKWPIVFPDDDWCGDHTWIGEHGPA